MMAIRRNVRSGQHYLAHPLHAVAKRQMRWGPVIHDGRSVWRRLGPGAPGHYQARTTTVPRLDSLSSIRHSDVLRPCRASSDMTAPQGVSRQRDAVSA
jgi:hypothetical protein